MDWHKKISVLLLGLCLPLGACLNLRQPSHKIDYYTLEYDPPQISGVKPLSVVVRIERFSVAPSYNTNRIIYRNSSFKRNAYVYHQWRASPADLVTHFLSRDMKQCNLFQAVLSYDSRFASSYVLEGSVDEFFEWDTDKTWKAVLSLTVLLMAEKEPDVSKKILFQKTYRVNELCKQKNPQAMAKAMSQAMAKVSEKITKDIYSLLSKTNNN